MTEEDPEHPKRRASAVPLNMMLLAASLAPLLPISSSYEFELELAFARLAVVLGESARLVRDSIEVAAAKSGFEITPRKLELWADSVLAGETGLTEILIAIDPDSTLPGLRGAATTDDDGASEPVPEPMCRPGRGKSIMPVDKLEQLLVREVEFEDGTRWVAGEQPKPSRARQLSKLGRW